MGSFEKPNWENWKAAERVEEKALWLVHPSRLTQAVCIQARPPHP